MRLWHKDLIPVLPRQQLISQWRECCAISVRLVKYGTPKHLLVDVMMKYPIDDFVAYAKLVVDEIKSRGYKVSDQAITKFFNNVVMFSGQSEFINKSKDSIFINWHNDTYFTICYYNLYEKYACGGISEDEFKGIKMLHKWR